MPKDSKLNSSKLPDKGSLTAYQSEELIIVGGLRVLKKSVNVKPLTDVI